jgi:hypothetical protein
MYAREMAVKGNAGRLIAQLLKSFTALRILYATSLTE